MANSSMDPPASVPAFDPELKVVLDALAFPPVLSMELMRSAMSIDINTLLLGRSITHEERTITGPDGNPLLLSILRPASLSASSAVPGILHTHGGGMVSGNRFMGIKRILDLVEAHSAIAVTPEYRLAPEHPFPAGFDDCYAALEWMAAHAGELGFSPEKLVVAGASAGGNLAAACALRARDEAGPRLLAQIVSCPMLDDRNDTVSATQFWEHGLWNGKTNANAWGWYLGEKAGGADVSPYAAPARAQKLKGLPPTFIDVGVAEVFREESVAYANQLWAAGVQCELHVWPGGFHAFWEFAPDAVLTKESDEAHLKWFARLMAQ